MKKTIQNVPTFRQHLQKIIFDSDTPAGRMFDKVLITLILLSLVMVVLDSVESISKRYYFELSFLEWIFTGLFTLEYAARIYCSPQRWRYIRSFFGIVDLLTLIPLYFAMLFPELHSLIDVRVLRLIRIFRIFKLTAYISEYTHLANAFSASRRKILVFLSIVSMVVLVMGTLMYVVEGPQHGFTSIPVGIYWAITTMTTVGYGDITPKTDLGRLISSVMMLMGWGTLAVPTGIMTAEMTQLSRKSSYKKCTYCHRDNLKESDIYCGSCGMDQRK